MVKPKFSPFQLWGLAFLFSLRVSSASDAFFINCGSPKNMSVDGRIFVSDSDILSTPRGISVNATGSNSLPRTNDSGLYETARVFSGRSSYSFPVKQRGRFFIRLHFFPFKSGEYDLSEARFSISAQNFTLIRDYNPPMNMSVVKEYSLNITANELTLEFSPKPNLNAFINALEVFLLPESLIPEEATFIGSEASRQNLRTRALETVARVNMGNLTVTRDQDKSWRFWDSESAYFGHGNGGKTVRNITAVKFSGDVTEEIAPASVYGTATKLHSDDNLILIANLTWSFNVDPGFDHFLRFHFCDIIVNAFGPKNQLYFNVYVNSLLVASLDMSQVANGEFGVPYFIDAVMRKDNGYEGYLNLSVGTVGSDDYTNAFINGFEILKISNEKLSLDVSDAILPKGSVPNKSSNPRIGLIAGLSAALCAALALCLVAFLLCRGRRRRRSRILQVVHWREDEQIKESGTTIGYRFPFAVIKEATDNFSESLVIGFGGFGKVYRGILRDKTEVAVKRGASHSQQGLAEFKTEIEMLSHFRHRHLVSLIGYCDENNEMIIVYEYMENGTLKNHLYGSDNPMLSWRKRLEICVGAARGLHYLHTGSAKAIIHRDVKSANILLDENFMSKVADFGLSKTGPDLDQTHVSTAVKGSFGYLDPEYLTRQQLTEKSDVYSFGVVMFEVLTGRPVIDPSLPKERVNLIDWVMKSLKNGNPEEIVDTFLAGQVNREALNKYCEIAEKCLAPNGIDRPSMGNVLWNLEFILKLEAKGDGTNDENLVDQSDMTTSTTQFSFSGGDGDIAGVSMSRVFAQMVREEEMR
ncbi:PREDICTED: probable receptor-like protein kinase At2g39360 [Tarenaya hassleriana]|uniref:probable receptor-like protein kinase At2g39360 n=1 Tax=Tarenaya hassleriana TaxID=28532 RepID=UPI00053C44BD|nr:PREDICTED: probable receptor-like protein kinase At2g39360 [Tarenaya hassleriana]